MRLSNNAAQGIANMSTDQLDDNEESGTSYEDLAHEFIEGRLAHMSEEPSNYGLSRDAFIGQLVLLAEFALLGVPQTPDDDEFENASEQLAELLEADASEAELKTGFDAEWANAAVNATGSFVYTKMLLAREDHDANCTHCNPAKNHNN